MPHSWSEEIAEWDCNSVNLQMVSKFYDSHGRTKHVGDKGKASVCNTVIGPNTPPNRYEIPIILHSFIGGVREKIHIKGRPSLKNNNNNSICWDYKGHECEVKEDFPELVGYVGEKRIISLDIPNKTDNNKRFNSMTELRNGIGVACERFIDVKEFNLAVDLDNLVENGNITVI